MLLLAERVLDAYGGAERWRAARAVHCTITAWGFAFIMKMRDGVRDLHIEAEFPHRWQQEVPALAKYLPSLVQDGPGLGRKARQRRVLGKSGHGDKQVLRQLLQFRDGGFGSHQPAKSPAGHAEVLGETVDHE